MQNDGDWLAVVLLWMQEQREEWLRYTARTVYWMQHRLLAWSSGAFASRNRPSYLLPSGQPVVEPGGIERLKYVLTHERFRPHYLRRLLINGPRVLQMRGTYKGPGW